MFVYSNMYILNTYIYICLGEWLVLINPLMRLPEGFILPEWFEEIWRFDEFVGFLQRYMEYAMQILQQDCML